MLKARISNTDIIGFDERQPISVSSSDLSSELFDARIGLVLNTMAALRTGAANVKIQILSDTNQNPSPLDNVEDSDDIIGNIKTISEESVRQYNDFIENKHHPISLMNITKEASLVLLHNTCLKLLLRQLSVEPRKNT